MFKIKNNCLIRQFKNEMLMLEPWGENSFRVRATYYSKYTDKDWALMPQPKIKPEINIKKDEASIKNGNIKAEIKRDGKLIFYNQNGEIILQELVRTWDNKKEDFFSALCIKSREFKPIIGGDYQLTVRFEPCDDEKIYGMGQYQQPYLNLKGCSLELAQRNSQVTVPFMVSSKGYGLLWNNPAIGEASFNKNITCFTANSTKQMDYWITAGDTPAKILESYSKVSGTVPMMPEFAMGYWQCKLRYRTSEEVLKVAREYKKRNIPLDVIVIDFFHWPKQGDWKFDERYFPNVDKMVIELEEMGIKTMVSVWPTVDLTCENYAKMNELGYLVKSERGNDIMQSCFCDASFYDTTNPKAREFVWKKIKKNYYDKGIKLFWLDVAEPEYMKYDFDNYRYYEGTNLQVGNIYPAMYCKNFFDGLTKEGETEIISLSRSAWAGAQKYGTLVWSGDIDSSFKAMKNQIAAGLNMGMAGMPWWTSDIGGFDGGDINNPSFIECLIRWFQYATFCPVMRLHGCRNPQLPPTSSEGGGICGSGADNEVWSFGSKAYEIMVKFINLRYEMKPYIKKLMTKAHEKGSPVIRPLFYDFQSDTNCWEVEDEFMFGPDVLVAPITDESIRRRKVYLPSGCSWKHKFTGEIYDGGKVYEIDAPIENIPVFDRIK